MQLDFIFSIGILILSVVIHEVSHGYVAQMLGDPTARLAGRLTLNPIKHIDPLGSIIVPVFLFLTNSSFLIGWAKPVPYNPYNLKKGKYSEALVAASGPLVNLLIALIFGLLIRFGIMYSFLSVSFIEIASFVVLINILLAIFNLLPIPPLDGSKVLKAFLPYQMAYNYDKFLGYITRFGMFASILFIFIFISFLWRPISLLISFIFRAITGI